MNNTPERRKYKRIKKNFILSYFDKAKPDQKLELTQLKNISLGGFCFVTAQSFAPGTLIGMELKTPYLSDTTYFEGAVLQSSERVKNVIYETRLEFIDLSSEAEYLLNKMMDFFTSEGQ